MNTEIWLAIIAGGTGVGTFVGWLIRYAFSKYDESNKSSIAVRDDVIKRQREREEQLMPAMKNVVDAVENITVTIDATHTEQKGLRKHNEQITQSLEDIKDDLRVLREAWGIDEGKR